MTKLTNSVFLSLVEALLGKDSDRNSPKEVVPKEVVPEEGICSASECDCGFTESVYREARAGVYVNFTGVTDSDTAFYLINMLREILNSQMELHDVKSEYSAYVNYDPENGVRASVSLQIEGESSEVLDAMFDLVAAAELYVEETGDEEVKSAEVHHTFSATSNWVTSTSDETLV